MDDRASSGIYCQPLDTVSNSASYHYTKPTERGEQVTAEDEKYENLRTTPKTKKKTESSLKRCTSGTALSLLLLWFLSLVLFMGICNIIAWQTIPQLTVKKIQQENRIPSDTLEGYDLKLVHTQESPCGSAAALVTHISGQYNIRSQYIFACENLNLTYFYDSEYDSETLKYNQSTIVPTLSSPKKIVTMSYGQAVYIIGSSRVYNSSTDTWLFGRDKIWKSVLTLNSTHGEFVRWEVWRELNFTAQTISPTLDGGIMVANQENVIFLDSEANIKKIVHYFSVSSYLEYRIFDSFLQQNGDHIIHAIALNYYRSIFSGAPSIIFIILSSEGNLKKVIYISPYLGLQAGFFSETYSVIAAGPDNYVFHASCGSFPQLTLMDWNVTTTKVLVNQKTQDLSCNIRAMSYNPTFGRLIVSENLDIFWSVITKSSKNNVKIFQVITP